MSTAKKASMEQSQPTEQTPAPHRMRMPGFLVDEEIGLGDVVKKVTTYLGVPQCGGCAHRTAALNRWLVVTTRKPR